MLVDNPHHDDSSTKIAAYADEFSAAGKITQLKKWWDTLCQLSPKFDYYFEGGKSWLIIKGNQQYAADIFRGTSIKITTDRQRYLGAVIGSTKYKCIYIQEKISLWIKELQMLCKFAWFEPLAAYSCFVRGFKHKPTFCMRTISNISSHLKRLDEVITTEFIPAITSGIICSDKERKLMSLPPKLGGMRIPIFSSIADTEYEFSQMLSNDLTSKIINRERQHQSNDNSIVIKNKIQLLKLQHHPKKIKMIRQDITQPQQRLNSMNQEQGPSSWLITLPIKEGYDLTKQLFWDLVRMRYNLA